MAAPKKTAEKAKTVKPTKRPMTIKKKKLIQGVVEGKSQKQAAIDAGYSPKSAESQASQILQEPKVKQSLIELMDEMGLSDSVLLAKHKELLNATRTTDNGDIPEYQIQAKALEMGYKLKSAFVEKSDVNVSGGLTIKIVKFSDV